MPIDMHAHWIPAAMSDVLRARAAPPLLETRDDGKEWIVWTTGGFPMEAGFDDVARRIASMDSHGINHGVLSLTTVFGVECLALDEALPLVRVFNDAVSDMCVAHPERFTGLAALPWADLDAAAVELERALALPGMVGALLPGDGFLSLERAERFRPLLEIANAHGSLIQIHYGPLHDDAGAPAPESSDNAGARISTLDMQARLSSNMITLVLTDFLDDFPNVKVQSHNLGGNIPFEVERLDHRALINRPDAPPPSVKFADMKLVVDCNSFGPRSIETAVLLYGADKIVLGTDGTNFGMKWSMDAIWDAAISDADRHAILRGNAAAIIEPLRAAQPEAKQKTKSAQAAE
jgi:predicted TIM-barrel fold metal-dependent hydrolase